MRGKLIIFEGLNGSGKTYYSNIIRESIPNTVYFKFPDRYTETGKKINKFLKKEIELPLNESIQLFIDNIFEHKINIQNKLNQGINVICDRYIISTITYNYTEIIQNKYINLNKIDKKITINLLDLINKIKGMIKPDFIFLINGNHIEKRNEEPQRYHNNNIFNTLILNNYITILTLLNNNNWSVINNTNINKSNTTQNIDYILKIISSIPNNDKLNYY